MLRKVLPVLGLLWFATAGMSLQDEKNPEKTEKKAPKKKVVADEDEPTAKKKDAKEATKKEEKLETFYVDPAKSQVKWKGKKKIIDSSHHGHLMIKEGTIIFKNGNPDNATFVMDMSSIIDEDLTNADDNAKLVGHLRSEDFFGVEKFPTATLKVNQFTKIPGNNGYTMTGDLTIKDSTNQVTFDAKVDRKNDTLVSSGLIAFDRTKFNVKYGSDKFFDKLGDKVIADDIYIEVSLVASPKPPLPPKVEAPKADKAQDKDDAKSADKATKDAKPKEDKKPSHTDDKGPKDGKAEKAAPAKASKGDTDRD